jgi:hypothetical protein
MKKFASNAQYEKTVNATKSVGDVVVAPLRLASSEDGTLCARPLIGCPNHFTRGKGKRDAVVLLEPPAPSLPPSTPLLP